MASANTLAAELSRKQQEHGAWLAAFKNADGGYDMTNDQVTEFRNRNAELDRLGADLETAREIEKSAADVATKLAPQGRMVKDSGEPEIKDGGSLEVAFRKAYSTHAGTLKGLAEGERGTVRFSLGADLKTVLTIGTSYTTQPQQVGRAESALYFGDVESYFPHGPASSASIVGYIQTTDTDNAAAVAEVTAATDSAFVWTPATDEIEDVQTWIPASRNLLTDEPQMRTVVTGMLAKRLQKVSNGYILNGTGTTPVPWGVFVRTGVQTQAKGNDPTMDAFHKAITLVAVTGDADPNLIAMHPNDWQDIRLTRTSDGVYILGNPSDTSAMRLWGLPVVASTGMTEGTGGVVDTSYTTIFENGGVTVEVSTEHSTYFTERKLAIALVRRFGAFHYRPSAACKVTGI